MSNVQLPQRTPPPGGAHAVRHVVLVTGASSGIGRATVLQLLRRGDTHVVLSARRRGELEETVRRAGERDAARTTIVVADLASSDGVAQLAATVRAQHPDLTALVNNAGAGAARDAFPPTAEATRRLVDLNLVAPLTLAQELLDLLAANRGAIVNVASVAGLVGTPGSPTYSATKWGLVGFSEALRARCAPLGVRVTSIEPGPVPTPGWPHERMARSPLRRLLASDVGAVAAAIERAACGTGRGRAHVVLPRTYASIPVLRGLAPWLLRALVAVDGRRAAREDRAAGRSGRESA